MCGISVIVALQGHHHHHDQHIASDTVTNGINGVHTNGNGPEDGARAKIAKELDQSLDQIAHRGPDSRGQWISEDKRIGPRPLT